MVESRPGFAPHRGDPSLAPSARGEGPQVRRSLDHSWKPGAFPGPGGGGAEREVLLLELSGLSEAISSPGPLSPGNWPIPGKMGNHKGYRTVSPSFAKALLICNSTHYQEPLLQMQRPPG